MLLEPMVVRRGLLEAGIQGVFNCCTRVPSTFQMGEKTPAAVSSLTTWCNGVRGESRCQKFDCTDSRTSYLRAIRCVELRCSRRSRVTDVFDASGRAALRRQRTSLLRLPSIALECIHVPHAYE